MSATDLRALTVILVAAAMTFATRALPFVLFGRKQAATPPLILFLGTYLPPAIIAMLVVYCLKDVQPLVYPYGAPEALALVIVALLHVWKRNFLLSIFGGTVLYMAAVQLVFVR
jgi:branched-subunit amino acid transport protein AzlD